MPLTSMQPARQRFKPSNYRRTSGPDRTAAEDISRGRSQPLALQTSPLILANAGLKSQLSAVLRDQLLGQLREVTSVDDAATWARRTLPAKNSLNVADAGSWRMRSRRGWQS